MFCDIATGIMIALKLSGFIQISWWLVFTPIIVKAILMAIVKLGERIEK